VTPSFLKVLPDGVHLIGLDNTGFDYITTVVTKPQFPALCPQTISATSQHISLGQGTLTALNFFVSPDGTLVYVVASDRNSVLVYNFNTSSVTGIPLANSVLGLPVTPVAASMTVDGTLIYVAGSDGTLHQLSTVAATDLLQVPFVATDNPFCSKNSTQTCTLNVVAVRP
jgi:DNA-binding beta-propeller fold protein YncE